MNMKQNDKMNIEKYVMPFFQNYSMPLYLRSYCIDPCILGGCGREYFEDRVRLNVPHPCS